MPGSHPPEAGGELVRPGVLALSLLDQRRIIQQRLQPQGDQLCPRQLQLTRQSVGAGKQVLLDGNKNDLYALAHLRPAGLLARPSPLGLLFVGQTRGNGRSPPMPSAAFPGARQGGRAGRAGRPASHYGIGSDRRRVVKPARLLLPAGLQAAIEWRRCAGRGVASACTQCHRPLPRRPSQPLLTRISPKQAFPRPICFGRIHRFATGGTFRRFRNVWGVRPGASRFCGHCGTETSSELAKEFAGGDCRQESCAT